MRKYLFLFLLFSSSVILGSPLDDIPRQPVFVRFQRNISYQHDRGLFLSGTIGPEWMQSIQRPQASGVRFGGDISLGWLPWENVALHATTWGAFLESSSF